MSQNSPPATASHAIEPPQENGFGLAGFIVSIAAIVLCGIPSMIGVVLSLIGLRKRPKGFAVAGLIIGIVGLLELLLAGFLTYSAYQVGKSASSFVQNLTVMIELQREAGIVGGKWTELDRIPTQAEGDELLKGKRDLAGNPFVYETDGDSFSIRTAGPDGTLQTEDDNVVGPFLDPNAIPKPIPEDSDVFGSAEFDEMFDEIEKQNQID